MRESVIRCRFVGTNTKTVFSIPTGGHPSVRRLCKAFCEFLDAPDYGADVPLAVLNTRVESGVWHTTASVPSNHSLDASILLTKTGQGFATPIDADECVGPIVHAGMVFSCPQSDLMPITSANLAMSGAESPAGFFCTTSVTKSANSEPRCGRAPSLL
jgi:hypothetical protein